MLQWCVQLSQESIIWTGTKGMELDKITGLAMLLVATALFLYYTIWTLLMVIFLICSDFLLQADT